MSADRRYATGKPGRGRGLTVATLGLLHALAVAPASALTIEFDYTYDTRGLFTTALGDPITERRAVLDAAAAVYAGFSDSLTAITPGNGDNWSVSFRHPSFAPGAVQISNAAIGNDTLRVYVGGSPIEGGVLGIATTGTVSASGSAGFVDSVRTRGQANALGSNATDYGVWGGSIWFNSARDWSYDLTGASLGAGQNDFYTTAVHELGHILGYGTAGSWNRWIDGNGQFAGPASVAAHGGPVALDSVRSHWAYPTTSETLAGLSQGALMDSSTPSGQRELMTRLDLAGFSDIGWQVSAVPEPASALLLLAGGSLLLAGRRRRTGAQSASRALRA